MVALAARPDRAFEQFPQQFDGEIALWHAAHLGQERVRQNGEVFWLFEAGGGKLAGMRATALSEKR